MALLINLEGIGAGIHARPLVFSTDFETGSAGNLHLLPDSVVAFSISPDPQGSEYLWFYFQVVGAGDKSLEFLIENASGAHQTGERWNLTRPVFSSDGVNWTRARDAGYAREFGITKPLGKMLYRFWAPFAAETLYVAYSYPYTLATLTDFMDSLREDPRCQFGSIGLSEDGREIPSLRITKPMPGEPPKQAIWIICREHPGETPASFVCEGVIQTLLQHPAGQRLLDHYDFKVVPILNVDGAARGFYYHNARGVNLARDWVDFASAEVRALRAALDEEATRGLLRLVVNLHASNDPTKGHFFIKTPESTLTPEDARMQQALFDAADGNHPQLQGKYRVTMLDIPGITGNSLYRKYGVYFLYLESNYSRGADGSTVTPQSLREVGRALVQALTEVFVPE